MQTIKNQGALWLLFLLLAAAFLSGCKPPGAKALLKGKQFLEAGKYQQAIEQLRTATTLLPTNALAYNYLGLALHQAGEPLEAEKAYLRALVLNHELVEIRYNLGCLWLDQNKPEQAKAELTAFTLRRGNSPEGWLKLGTAQLRTHEPTAAERSFTEALRLKPKDAEATAGVGLARLARNRPQEGALFFRKALQERPDYAPALLNLAVVSQEQLKDKNAALQLYRRYLAVTPKPDNVEQVARVVKALEQELGPPMTPSVTNPPAQKMLPANLAEAQVSKAPLPIHESKPAVLPTNPPASARPEPAVLQAKTQTKPEPSRLVPQAPVAAKSPSLPEPAKTSPAPSTALTPTTHRQEPSPAPLEVVTVPNEPILRAAEDMPARSVSDAAGTGGQKTEEPAAESKPAKKGFIQKINPARLFTKDEKPTSTAVATDEPKASPSGTADSFPPDPDLLSRAFPRYAYKSPVKPQSGNRAEAERAFAQGVQAHNAHRLPEAMSAYRRAVQLDPAYFDAYYNLGAAAGESGNLQLALSSYESALAIRSQSLDARYSFALALKQSNYAMDAVNELQKLLATYPNDSRAHLLLGNLYDQQFKEPSKAKVHYLKVLETDPRNPEAGAIRYWLAAHPVK